MNRPLKTALLLLGLAMLVSPAAAQKRRRIELTPFVGGLIPTGQLGAIRVPGLGSTPVQVTAEMLTAGGFGGRATIYGPGRLGVEGTYFMSGNDMRIAVGPFNRTFDADVQGGSIKAVFEATTGGTGTDLVLSGGVSGIKHGGTAFALASDQFDIGGVLGGGLHITMSPTVTLRFDGDFYMYRWSAGPGFASRTQTDFMMTAGLGLRLGR